MVALAKGTEQTPTGTPLAAPDRVYADLRERIINFDLPPGAMLARNDLATTYGVSQTPVREALQRLEQDGLIRIYPQSKTVVSQIDVRQLNETLFLRVAVETEVVRRLAKAPERDQVIARARALVQMQQVLAEGGQEMDMFADLDRSFHLLLFASVGMGSLHAMLVSRLGHLYRCQRLELPRDGKMQNIVDAHQSILDMLGTGDPEAAAEAMRAHLSGTINRIQGLQRDFPDYFTGGELS